MRARTHPHSHTRCLHLILPLTLLLGCNEPEVLQRRFKVLGGTIRQVTFGGGGQPDWSAESNRIAYVHQGQVRTIKPDGGDELQMTDLPGEAGLPRFRPGTDELAFAHETPDGQFGIQLLGEGAPTVLLDDLRPVVGLTWSADGERLFFIEEGSPDGIEYMAADGGGRGALNNSLGWGKVIGIRSYYTRNELLYVEVRGGVYNLYRISGSGGEPVRLTDYSSEDPIGSIMSRAAPSRDGSRLAVLSSQEHPYGDIMLHMMPSRGGTMVQLIDLNAGVPAHPVWSPDDREIALQLTGILMEIWVLELK